MFHEPGAPVSGAGVFTTSISATLRGVLSVEPAWKKRWKNIQGLVLFFLVFLFTNSQYVKSSHFLYLGTWEFVSGSLCNIYPNRCHSRYRPVVPAVRSVVSVCVMKVWCWHTHTHTQPLRLILGVALFDVRRLNPRRRSSEPPAVCMRWYHIAPVPNRRPRSGLINGRHYWVGADKHVSMVFLPQPVSLRCLRRRRRTTEGLCIWIVKGDKRLCLQMCLKTSQPSHKKGGEVWSVEIIPAAMPLPASPKRHERNN